MVCRDGLGLGPVLDFTDMEDELDEDVAEIEDPWTGAGDKAAMDLPKLAVAEDGKVMELMGQEYIRRLLKSPPPTKPLPDSSVEAIRQGTGIRDEEDLETIARAFRALQSIRDTQNDIIQQYLDKGYAYVEIPDEYSQATPGELPPLP